MEVPEEPRKVMKRIQMIVAILVGLSLLSGIVWNSDINPFVMAGAIKRNQMSNHWQDLQFLRIGILELELQYENDDGSFKGKRFMKSEDRLKYEQMIFERDILWEKVGLKKKKKDNDD